MLAQNNAKKKLPRFSQYMALSNRNIAHARVLEQVYYYHRNPKIKIGNVQYTAPPTDRLVWELGICRRTIINAISALSKAGVFEVRYKKIRGCRRRCIRLLKDPCDEDIGPAPGEDQASAGTSPDPFSGVHGMHPTGTSEEKDVHQGGAREASDRCTVEHTIRLKKEDENGTKPLEDGVALKKQWHINSIGRASPLSSPESPPPRTPDPLRPTDQQQGHAVAVMMQLRKKRGWDYETSRQFVDLFTCRLVKERIKEQGNNFDPPKPPLSLSPRPVPPAGAEINCET